MFGNTGVYANKKRKKPVLKQKKISDGNDVVKSNPSKRHRDRLNGELDRLMDLLPFTEDVRSRLDKLSVLRLSVGYLRVKSFFKTTMKNNHSSLGFSGVNGQNGVNGVNGIDVDNVSFSEGDLLLQALNGFVVVVTAEGSVFYASPTIKDYLGFHQSDVVHQSVFELIHTDDRTMFREQLHFALNPPPAADGDGLQIGGITAAYSPEQLPPENSSFLERSFVCRFRCLLDNSSGFLALKFQGRLRYLHGQSLQRDTGARAQLALFAIAVPVQPPSIVEIRTKTLLFQTKHKMDFTPTGICSRGKIILGYSEAELCTKGSGYQFIHAADMMYCADNHIRMMKTGESGLTVFRLLSKSSGWVWVKSNAKVIFKGGRPDFIIAYQQALVNTEGEEYFRQRRLQLPFSFTTGEAVLYTTSPTVDIPQFQFDKKFSSGDVKKDAAPPKSLLDCFLRQNKDAYRQPEEVPLPVDQVFMDSCALLKVTNEAGEPAVVKEEAKQSVMDVIDSLEKMAQSGDFGETLQHLDLGDAELMEWEGTLKRLSQDEDQQSNVKSDLDSILTKDIFDYVESLLFKEKGEDLLSAPSCLNGLNQHQDLFTQLASELCEPPLFPTPSPDHAFPSMNGVNGGGVSGPSIPPAQVFGSTQKLTHQGPTVPSIPTVPLVPQVPPVPQVHPVPPVLPVAQVHPANTSLPPLQHLQLQDIFSPSIELPALTVPNISADDALATFQSCGQASIRHTDQQANQLLLRQNHPVVALQSPVQQPNSVAPVLSDSLPPLIPCRDFTSSSPPNIPAGFSSPCPLRFDPPQQWNQNQNQKLPHTGILQNGHEAVPVFQSQNPQSQTFPCNGLWPGGTTGLNQQGALPGGQAANLSSCMFNQHFSSNPPGGVVPPPSGAPGLRGADPSLDQSPAQASCCFQWNHSEPTVRASAIGQENANIGPLAALPNMSAAEYARSIQHYLQNNRQTQQTNGSSGGLFVALPHDVSSYLME